MPDLTFAELTFARTHREPRLEPSEDTAKRKARAQETLQQRQKEISTYFAHIPPENHPPSDQALGQPENHGSEAQQAMTKEGSTSGDGDNDQISKVMRPGTVEVSKVQVQTANTAQRPESPSAVTAGEENRECGRLVPTLERVEAANGDDPRQTKISSISWIPLQLTSDPQAAHSTGATVE